MNPSNISTMYRGQGHPIPSTATTVPAILSATDLNWKVCEVPVLMQGKHENRPFPSRKALVRCDTGTGIEIVSHDFKVHQNAEIVAGMAEAAAAGGIKLISGGHLDNGSHVFLHGTVNRSFDASGPRQLGDTVRLDIRLRGGHIPGTPSRMEAVAFRLRCLNGATYMERTIAHSVSHRRRFTADDAAKVQQFITAAVREFETYEQKAKRLMGYSFTRQETEVYVLELLQPELLRMAAEKIDPATAALATRPLSDYVVDREEAMAFVGQMLAGKVDSAKPSRTVKGVLEAVNTQPGSDIAANTAWNAYNAVTYYVDHVRGRSDAAVLSAMFGDGARMKRSALELAVEYTERSQN